jgi:hypothetical protein
MHIVHVASSNNKLLGNNSFLGTTQSPISLFAFSQGASNFRAPGNQSLKVHITKNKNFSNIPGESGAATGPTATALPATRKRRGVKFEGAK